ncbi:MAG: hypothetical protein ABI417_05275 [Coleofasciculaceae cyanobacterium]
MNEIPPEGMSNEEYNQLFEEDEYDEFDRLLQEKIEQFLESLTSEQRENIPEIQALMMIFFIKELDIEKVLEILRQTNDNAEDLNFLADWRSRVQAKLRETSNEELGIDNSQRQQIERVLLGLDQ